MTRRVVERLFLATLFAFAAACNEPVNSIGVACPKGTMEWSPGADTERLSATSREEAISAVLRHLEMPASRDAIAEAVIGSGPGPDPGKEEAVVETKNGAEVSMTLRPLNPGWVVVSARWCADEAS